MTILYRWQFYKDDSFYVDNNFIIIDDNFCVDDNFNQISGHWDKNVRLFLSLFLFQVAICYGIELCISY